MKQKLIIIGCFLLTIIFIIMCFLNIKISRIVEEVPDEPTTIIMSSKEIISQVLRGEKEFVDESGKEVSINNITIDDANVKINSYTYVDIDNDKEDELVAITDSYYGYYLVLDVFNNMIYGYNINLSDMDYINMDGIILDNIENDRVYKQFVFDRNSYKTKNIAVYKDNEYKISDNQVTEEEFKDYENKFASSGLVIYKALNTSWMEKKLTTAYSLTDIKSYIVNTNERDFLFLVDKNFENFKNDLVANKINIYYIDSNSNSGKMILRKSEDDINKFNDELNDKKVICLFDENTQYIALVINNDKLNSDMDNNYDIYYFKYYNKTFQFLGNYRKGNYTDLFNETILNELQ